MPRHRRGKLHAPPPSDDQGRRWSAVLWRGPRVFQSRRFHVLWKEQGANAPTCVAAAFRYGAALNRLLDSGAASRNRIRIGDATVAFWADASGVRKEAASAADQAFGLLMEPPSDEAEAAKLRDLIDAVRRERPTLALDPALRADKHFHVLGLAPNAARLSVRFWLTDTFEPSRNVSPDRGRTAHDRHSRGRRPARAGGRGRAGVF